MNKYILSFFVAVAFVSCGRNYPSFVAECDGVLNDREIFQDAFDAKTDQIRISLDRQNDPVQIYDLRMRLAKEYLNVSFDTTHLYLSRNLSLASHLGRKNMLDQTRILMAINYSTCGFYQEASQVLHRINEDTLAEELKADFCKAHIILTRRSRNIAPSADDLDNNQKELEYWLSKMESLVDSTSYNWNYIQWEKSRNRKDSISGISLAHKSLEAATRNSPEYSEACFYLALSYREIGDDHNFLKWTCNSVINDVRIASRSDIALVSLSDWFYKQGDVKRAYDYAVGIAFPDALKMNNRYNLNVLSNVVQTVSAENDKLIRRSERVVFIVLIILFVFAAGLVAAIIIVYRNNKILRATHLELKHTDKMKEKYIKDFLLMLAQNTMDRRNNYAHAVKMLRSNRGKELLGEIEQYQDDEDPNTFIRLFDSTFLDLYPDFVDQFNALLKPEERIVPSAPGTLTPELRIYALMKLGVSDLQEIAVLLQYANSTIYNYRVKVLSRTLLSKKDFENRLRNL